ncbi:MAG: hypothetical protein HZC28_17405 [Spirochaetes bacterium]|nr:hypothetical protein [Spirochaetota bacterium]
MLRVTIVRCAAAMLCLYAVLTAAPVVERMLTVDVRQTQKDLTHSYLGANAQQFRFHYSVKAMLDQSAAFATFMSNIGLPVIRMDGRNEYGWFSIEEDRKLSGNGSRDSLWFSMDEFHRFCRANNIRLIGAFRDEKYYDEKTGTVVVFRDTPDHFDGGVANNIKKLSWVVSNGYQDLYTAWEIGNECWSSWDPVLYAQFARKMVNAALAVHPGIRLTVPVMLRNTDDPAIKTFMAKVGRSSNWFSWHEKMLPALGEDIKKISHLQIHVYGSASMYSANYRGLETISDILAKQPNTDHFRYLVTEWRYTGVGGVQHRTFRTGALWNAKFAMTLLSYPKVDYTAAHEFLCTSGLGYWSPGTEWMYQYPEEKQSGKAPRIPNKTGTAQFDIGPFGPVNRMLNELVKECPVLVEHKSDLGPMSSALYVDGWKQDDSPKASKDLDWFICAKKDRSKIGGVIVNTTDDMLSVNLSTGEKKYALMDIYQMTCDADKQAQAEIPGEEKFWHVSPVSLENGRLMLPPNSITSFRGTPK